MRRKNADSGVGECLITVVLKVLALAGEVTFWMVCRIVDQKQSSPAIRAARLAALGDEAAEIDIAPDIAIDDKKRFIAEPGQCPGDPASRFQGPWRFRTVLNLQLPALAIAQCGRQLFAKVGGIDHDFTDAGCRQLFQVPDNERLATDRQQGFGRVVGQRSHAFTAAGGEDHGFHRVRLVLLGAYL